MSNFSITPLRAYYDTRLEQEDIILLSIICEHTDRDGFCFPSLKTLSAIFSPIVGRQPVYNISSMSRKIAKLQAAGYVAATVHRKTEAGSYKSNVYRVIYDAVLPPEFDRRENRAPLANAPRQMQLPLANAPEEMQTPLANALGQMQSPLANAPGQMQTNGPIERPSNERAGTAPPSIFSLYEKNIGLITPGIADRLKDAEKEFPLEWIQAAIEEALIANVRKWNYIDAILKRWKVEGRGAKQRRGMRSVFEEGMRIFEEKKNGKRSNDYQGTVEIFPVPELSEGSREHSPP